VSKTESKNARESSPPEAAKLQAVEQIPLGTLHEVTLKLNRTANPDLEAFQKAVAEAEFLPTMSTQRRQADLASKDLKVLWPPKEPVGLVKLCSGRSNVLHPLSTPFGQRAAVYADYATSGLPLKSLKGWIGDTVYPILAGVPSQAGSIMQQRGALIDGAFESVADFCSAPRDRYSIAFTGSGAGQLRIFARLLGIHPRQIKGPAPSGASLPVVVVSNMETRSNIGFWQDMECKLEVRAKSSERACPSKG
jgi:hypothetical protein